MLAGLIKGAISAWQDGMDYLRDRRKRTNLIKELDMCGPEECRGLLGQYGLTRKQFENAIRIPFASEDLASAALRSKNNKNGRQYNGREDERLIPLAGTML